MHSLTTELTRVLAHGVSSRAVIPSYETPKHRFLEGRGELLLGDQEGFAFTIWEALVHFKESEYPIAIEGEVFTKADLLFHAAQNLSTMREQIVMWVKEEGFQKIWKMCVEFKLDPSLFS